MGPKSYHDAISGWVLIVQLIFAWALKKVSSVSHSGSWANDFVTCSSNWLSANTVVKIDKDVWAPILNSWKEKKKKETKES